tara:strand:+ start:350 stop:1678 length:1329 start_codon:yes stop_codon:yes gene_type:complete
MSSLPTKDIIGVDSIAGAIKNPLGAVSKLFSSEFEKQSFGVGGEDVFRAVVISQPVLIKPSEYKALGYDGDDIQSDRSYKKFKVRIAKKEKNPHSILQDPCDLTKAADLCHQNALVATHTTVATHQHLGLNMGSFIEVRLHRNSNETYNLQVADFVGTLQVNETGAKVLNEEFCDSVKAYFKFGDSYSPPPAIRVNSQIMDAADRYDNNKNLPGKKDQKKYLYGNRAPAVKAPFDVWAKALIQLAHEAGLGKVIITSGYRTVAQQQKLHDEYVARGRTGLPAACGTCSRHTNGFALDLNFFWNGTLITSKMNKQVWERSGFVAIAKSLGLEWGGEYTKYDPVHFQLNPKGFTDQDWEQMGYSPNRNYDVVQEGITAKEQRNHEDAMEGRGQYTQSATELDDREPEEIMMYDLQSDSSAYESPADSDELGESVDETLIDPDDY